MLPSRVPAEIPCCACAEEILAHHLGNALTIAGGFLDLALRDRQLGAKTRERLERARAGVRRLAAVRKAVTPCRNCICTRNPRSPWWRRLWRTK